MAPVPEVELFVPVNAIKQKTLSKPVVAKTGSIVWKTPKASGLLDQLYPSEELTPAIGRLYPTLQLSELLEHEAADELIRDLAIIISRRGVVIFKSQDISPEQQKFLTNRLGQLTGKPSTSGLHVHPVYNAERTSNNPIDEKGTRNQDNEISVINSDLFQSLEVFEHSDADEWHSDIAFEPVPADYTSLKVHTLPSTGGDTLWSSGYELYDRLSPAFRTLAESLEARFHPPEFIQAARKQDFGIYPGPRGAAENVNTHLTADHPVVRTNPVTGWKTLFGAGQHFSRFKGLSTTENRFLRDYFHQHIAQTHTAQVRHRWEKNDLAIWDNRSTYHAATPDYFSLGSRSGVRAVSCGETPYLDPASVSRKAELGSKLI
ncbi:2-oxoglutarate-dependent dioxygenase [Malassezia pachydermatis]|uniref:Alpha-ketoglutarate-dependent sulfonate n=1 Tax=Malassezia pachydermatis TaxID=77020 RepID=A0A0M8MUW9_9BASI|nr:alpha-ketoglutarate-dependent sulfonate [Malassezia pachydermatis]KOS14091.1 alpha-ketoglutarate-dependent sulfonate [Malassezia pachydermatis]